jgi:diaminopimelate decarboxylase
MADLALKLAKQFFEVENGELRVGGSAISVLAKRHGTPCFIYYQEVIDRKLDSLRAALPSCFSVCYSVKANPHSRVLRHFLARGCRLEIASMGEFRLAIEAGCKPENILFAGPGKTEAELEYVISRGIGEIHLESFTEAHRAVSICKRLSTRANVAIRVNPAGDAEGGAMRMGGRPAVFGVDEEVLDTVLDVVRASGCLLFRGLHLFAGTQILDAAVLLNQYKHGLDIARRVVNKLGSPLKTLDFGGGLGICYFPNETELNLNALKEGLAALFADIDHDPAFAGTHFLVEPGRFLVGESGIYVARINDIKVSRGKKFLVLDGGMNHHLSASGNLGQAIKRNFPVALLNKLDAPPSETVDVVGPLCTPLDTLARNVALPTAEIGDLFGIFQSGAYGRSASPAHFLSHPAPAEVWLGDQETGSSAESSAVAQDTCCAAQRVD